MNDYRPWTRQEDETARRMDEQNKPRREIGRVIGRSHHAVASRLRYLATLDRDWTPTPEMIEDRNVRALLPHRDLTAAFCGDPKIGQSALDMIRDRP